MKSFLSFSVLLCNTLLLSHGFSADMLVLLSPQGWQRIDAVCYRAQKRTIELASYDTHASAQQPAHVVRSGKSKTNSYVRVQLDDSVHHDIVCTPTQEFYHASKGIWIPAYKLKVGDELVCAHDATQTVVSILLIKEPLRTYTVEVADTHTFFVGALSVLTHNMVLPMAFSIALSIPFGVSTGSTAGSFFGPVTCAIGAAIGGMVGLIVTAVCDSRVPRYTLGTCDVNTFEQCIQTHSVQSYTISSQPEIVCSPYYIEDTETYSISVPPKIEEKPGCGSTTPQKPLILITDAAPPIPLTASPGCFPIEVPIRDSRLINDAVPPKGIEDQILVNIPVPLQGPQILCAGQTVDDAISIMKDKLRGLTPFGKQSKELIQSEANNTYEEAIRIIEENTNPNTIKDVAANGKTMKVYVYENGKIIVRDGSKITTTSTSMPTVEIQFDADTKLRDKTRLSGTNQEEL